MKRDSIAWCRDRPTRGSLQFLEFRLDRANQCLWRRVNSADETRVPVTPKAFDVLSYLVERAGQLVQHEELLDALWPARYVQPEVLKHQVLKLRKTLGDDPRHPRCIETVQRRGYRFLGPVSDSGVPARAGDVSPEPMLLAGRREAFVEPNDSFARALESPRQSMYVNGDLSTGRAALLDEFQRRATAAFADVLTQLLDRGFQGFDPIRTDPPDRRRPQSGDLLVLNSRALSGT